MLRHHAARRGGAAVPVAKIEVQRRGAGDAGERVQPCEARPRLLGPLGTNRLVLVFGAGAALTCNRRIGHGILHGGETFRSHQQQRAIDRGQIVFWKKKKELYDDSPHLLTLFKPTTDRRALGSCRSGCTASRVRWRSRKEPGNCPRHSRCGGPGTGRASCSGVAGRRLQAGVQDHPAAPASLHSTRRALLHGSGEHQAVND